MSQKEAGSTHLWSHQNSIDLLLKCYGSKTPRRCKKIVSKHVSVINHTDSDPLSASRHLEQRLRPQTCDACRACATTSLRNSAQDIVTLLPLDQRHRLPYYSAKANQNKPKASSKSDAAYKLRRASNPRAKNSSTSSCSSSPHSGPSDTKMNTLSAVPTLSQSGPLPQSSGCVSAQKTQHPHSELRTWIVAFGGDVQAAFMARGLQRLQLAYELGKAETDPQTANGALPEKR